MSQPKLAQVQRLARNGQIYQVIGSPDARRVIMRRHAERVKGQDAITSDGEIDAFWAGFMTNHPLHFLATTGRARTQKTMDRFSLGYKTRQMNLLMDRPRANELMSWPTPRIQVIDALGSEADERALVTPKVERYIRQGMSQIEAFRKAHGDTGCRELALRFVKPLRDLVFGTMKPSETAVVFSHEPLIVLTAWAHLNFGPFSSHLWRKGGSFSPALNPLEGYEFLQVIEAGKIQVVPCKVVGPLRRDAQAREFTAEFIKSRDQMNIVETSRG